MPAASGSALGAALTNVFGRIVGDQRQGWAVLAVMGVLFIAGVIVCYAAEAHGNDLLNALGLNGGNMEGCARPTRRIAALGRIERAKIGGIGY